MSCLQACEAANAACGSALACTAAFLVTLGAEFSALHRFENGQKKKKIPVTLLP